VGLRLAALQGCLQAQEAKLASSSSSSSMAANEPSLLSSTLVPLQGQVCRLEQQFQAAALKSAAVEKILPS
jgi:hypothetical protein